MEALFMTGNSMALAQPWKKRMDMFCLYLYWPHTWNKGLVLESVQQKMQCFFTVVVFNEGFDAFNDILCSLAKCVCMVIESNETFLTWTCDFSTVGKPIHLCT